jgi:serine/threonine protein kinase
MTSPRSWERALENVDQSQLELAGVGSFAQVIKIADTGFVIKKQNPHPVVGDLQPIEKNIYERLGHHPFILRYYGEYQGVGVLKGLVFQYLPGGTLSDNLPLSNYTEERTK